MPQSLGSNYRKLLAASAFSNLADGVFQIALPLLALRITQSPSEIAGIALVSRLPWLLFALHAGALADRLDRRVTMTRVDVARALMIGGLAAVAAAGREELWILYVVAFALGIGETLFDTSAQSLMPSLVPTDQLSRANGRLYAAELTTNQFVGPPLGGVLVGVSVALAFGGAALSYLLAAVALFALKGSFRPERSTEPSTLRHDIAEGVRYLARHRLLRTFALMVGVANLTYTAVFAVFPLFAVKPGPLGLSEFGFGLILTFLAVGSLIGSLVASRVERVLGRHRLLMVSVLISGPPLALWATANVVVVAATSVVSSIGIVMWNVVTVSLRQRVVPNHLLGRVNSAYRLLAWGTMPIGAALGGLLAELVGIRTLLVVCGSANALMVLLSPLFSDAAMDEAERSKDLVATP